MHCNIITAVSLELFFFFWFKMPLRSGEGNYGFIYLFLPGLRGLVRNSKAQFKTHTPKKNQDAIINNYFLLLG